MNLRVSLFFVSLIGLLVAFSLAPWDDFLCKQPFVVDLLQQKNKDGAVGCFEFWFNRYQTLIGTFAAVGAAAAAWLASQGQISAAKHQAQVGQQQYAAAALPVLEMLYNKMNEADSAVTQLKSALLRLVNVVKNSRQSLSAAYESDGRIMGDNFTKAIIYIYRSDQDFERAETNFESAYKAALEVGSRMTVSSDVIREYSEICEAISYIKTECVHIRLDYENIYNYFKEGEADIPESIWYNLREVNFDEMSKLPDQALFKDAHKQMSSKIENIVGALIS
ncbi:hypothetical protein [Methylorubrum sp. POS3]|uniref:hypothetical protein n=1 Tax=Methylorubrum sp. POS3 TaxID=2998492 RepID=UPI003729A6CB